jgi:hypothetical protein
VTTGKNMTPGRDGIDLLMGWPCELIPKIEIDP